MCISAYNHSDGFLELILDSHCHEKIPSLYEKIREVRRVFVFWEKQALVMIWNLISLVQTQTRGFPALCNI